MTFNFREQEFDTLRDLLIAISVPDMKRLYELFVNNDKGFCAFLFALKPAFFKSYEGRHPGWHKFFNKLYYACLEDSPSDKLLNIRLQNMEKAYEKELQEQANQEAADIQVSPILKPEMPKPAAPALKPASPIASDFLFNPNFNHKSKKIIILGNYPFFENGIKKPIEWLVLAENDTSMLLISDKGLDVHAYNDMESGNQFENSSLAAWLARDFSDTAFNADEKSMLEKKPFILSAEEALKYFKDDAERTMFPTPYAVTRGASEFKNGTSWWWLATPGSMNVSAAYVSYKGKVKREGEFVVLKSIAVRPAIIIRKK
ncbi:MAG: DUF6273 domain-containing protein [Elusimicrobiales bacterium]|nr:DUF6273 domain-containing protein [Elusimicrobiales bacterium]